MVAGILVETHLTEVHIMVIFDPRQEEEVSFDVLPPGDYPMVIISAGFKPTRAGGRYVSVQCEVFGGPHARKKFFEGFAIEAASETGQRIARGRFKSLMKVVGLESFPIQTEADFSRLANKTFIGSVGVRKSQMSGEDENYIKSYKPGQANKPFAPPATTAQQSMQQPGQQMPPAPPFDPNDVPF
jgi:hypothetical protein